MSATLMDMAGEEEQGAAVEQAVDEQGQAVAGGDSSPDDSPAPGDRPDYLPEKFWDPKTGQARIEELAKSQKDFETKWRTREGTKVENAGDYEYEIPEGTEHLLMQSEDGAEDPLLANFREYAHQSGMSQEMFQATIDWYLKTGAEMVQPYDPEAELAKMGPRGKETVGMLSAKTRQLVDTGVLTDEEKNAFVNMWSTAENAQIMAKILQAGGEQAIPDGGAGKSAPVSNVELDQMYQEVYEDGPYKGQRKYAVDKNFRAKVDKLFEQRYGNQPVHTSRDIGA